MKLSAGYKNLTPGPDQVLTITKAVYDAKYDKLRVSFRDETGGTGTEQFMFVNDKDEPNEVSLNVFSTMVKAALHDWTLKEIDDFDEIVGCQVLVNITADESKGKDGVTRTYTHLRNYREAPVEEDEDLEGIL